MSQINPIRKKAIVEMDNNEIGYIHPSSLWRDFQEEECTSSLYFLFNTHPVNSKEDDQFSVKIQCTIENGERIYTVFWTPEVSRAFVSDIPLRLITTFLSVGEETITDTHSTDTTASKKNDKKEAKNKESEAIEKLHQYEDAINFLKRAVFELNNVFSEEDEDEEREEERDEEINEEELDPLVKELFQEILNHTESIINKPKESDFYDDELDNLMQKVRYSFGIFLDEALKNHSQEEKTEEIIKATIYHYPFIETGVSEVVKYKTYKKVSKEYKFTKTLLTDLEHEIQKYPYIKEGRDKTDIAPSIEELFAKFYALDIKFVKSLSPYERSSLIKLAEFYEQYSLLEKLRDNKLTPPIRD